MAILSSINFYWRHLLTTPADIGAIVGLSANSDGNIFVVGETSRKVHCYRGSGWTVHIDKLPAKKAKEILGLAVKEDGTTYISSVESDRIFVFNPGAVNWENLGVGPDKDITGLAIDTRGSKSTRDYAGIAETVETVNVVEVGVDEAFGVDEGQRRIAAAHIPVSTAETTGLKEDLDHGIDAASTKTEAFGLADTIITGKLITASVDEQFGVAHKSAVASGIHVDDALGLLEAADLRGALSLPLTETLDWSDARPVVGRLLGVNLNERLGITQKSAAVHSIYVDDALGLFEAADLRGALSLLLTETLDWSYARPIIEQRINLSEPLGLLDIQDNVPFYREFIEENLDIYDGLYPRWPLALPSRFDRAGFSQQFGKNMLEFPVTHGRPMRRKQFTKTHKHITGQMLMDTEQWEALLDFYYNELNAGINVFELLDPIKEYMTVMKFTEPPSRISDGGLRWRVKLQMRVE